MSTRSLAGQEVTVDKSVVMGIVVAFLVVMLLLMLLGWHNRRRRQSTLAAPRNVDGSEGEPRFVVDAFYVATTVAASPLDRIAVGGLGFRARASVAVTDGGVILGIPGQRGIWIPADELLGVDNATWTIDRVVERDGLVLLAWRLPADDGTGTGVDSYLRFDSPTDSQEFMAAVARLLDTPAIPSPQGGTDQ